MSSLIVSDDPTEFLPLLLEHFEYLADTPGYQSVLEELLQQVLYIDKDEDHWRIVFNEGEEWEQKEFQFGEPLEKGNKTGLPEYHRKLLEPHSWMRAVVGYDGIELNQGYEYSDDPEWGHVPEEFRQYLPELLAPIITSSSQKIFYHPSDTNEQGWPLLCYTSSKQIEKLIHINAGAYMLQWMAEEFDIDAPGI